MNNDDRAKLEALPAFDDPHVQIVYRILCDTDLVPPPDEHWEGFTARHVVAALASAQAASAEQVAPCAASCLAAGGGTQDDYCNLTQGECARKLTTPAPAVAPAAVTDEQIEAAIAVARRHLHDVNGVLGDETLGRIVRAILATRTPEPPISLDWTEDEQWVRSQLQRMILSSRVLVGSDGAVTGYQIKTGALHKLIGRFAVNVPLGLPEVAASPTPDEQRAQAAQEDVEATVEQITEAFVKRQRDVHASVMARQLVTEIRAALAGRQQL